MPKKINQGVIDNSDTSPILPDDVPSYDERVDVGEEKNDELLKKLQPIAEQHNAALLAFIAPSFGKKTSPVDLLTASIGFWEELGIEEAVRNIIKHSHTKRLFLLVESRGGGVDSSYKIARHLRYTFANIITFVPHLAASGGALLTLIGNEVVMGEMANLTPIDVQVYYSGTRVSVNRMSSAIARLVKYFETALPEQVPYPYRVMADKLDPIIFDDWNIKTNGMVNYAIDILTKTGYKDADVISIIENLILTNHPHSFVIHKDLARKYGINIVRDNKYDSELNCMRWWLKKYILNRGILQLRNEMYD